MNLDSGVLLFEESGDHLRETGLVINMEYVN
jgi:hypothetical protein